MDTEKPVGYSSLTIESSIIALLGYVIVTLAAICMIKKKSKSVISIKKQNPVCWTESEKH